MKSKKKLLLMGVGVMGALAMGVGATSTFAWFQATSSASAAFLSRNGTETLSAGKTSVDATTLKVIVNAMPNSTGVQLSTSDAHAYGYTGDTLYEDSDVEISALVDYITLSVEGIKQQDGETDATDDDLAQIANGTTFEFTIQGGDRTRLYGSSPADAAAFDDSAPHNTLTIVGTFTASAASCAFSIKNGSSLGDNKLYYSIAGQIVLAADIAEGGYWYNSGSPTKTAGQDLSSTDVEDFWENASTSQKAAKKDAGSSLTQSLTLAAA